MNHLEMPTLSQEAMETWFQQVTTRGSRLLSHGVVQITLGLLCHYYTKPHVVTTVSLNTTYHKPIFLGDSFHIKAKFEFQGRSLCNITGEAWIKNKTVLAASSSAVFKVLKEVQNNPLI